MIPGRRRADAAGDVVVAGKDIRHQRPQHIKRRAMAERALQLHVVFDLIERHVAGPFDHHLHAFAPGTLGEFAERDQLGELRLDPWRRPVRRGAARRRCEKVTSYSRMMSQMSSHIVYIRFCLLCDEHPLGQQRSAAADDADQALADERQMFAQHAGVDGEIIDALLRPV